MPLTTILLIVSAAVPELVNVTLDPGLVTPAFWLLNTRVVGDAIAAATPTPVPVKATVCVDPEAPDALSDTVKTALRLPTAAGSKVIAILQLDDAAKLAPQLFVALKSLALIPLIAMLEILSTPVPELLNVTVFEALVLLTFWLPKAIAVGETAALGTPVPEPLSVMV